jgi:tRNA (mo5U34)-methyltransferase
MRVLDVGSGNGFFGWRLLEAGAEAVIGIDPALLYCMQHLAAVRLYGGTKLWVLPLTLEEAPSEPCFDLVLSMGVIYHRKDPLDHLRRLFTCCRPGATVVIESLVVDGGISLHPAGRYARMRNVSVVPSVPALRDWLQRAGFDDPRAVDVTTTRPDEQRTTGWMPYESLREALDPADPSRTVEGHPAPLRAIVLATRPHSKVT